MRENDGFDRALSLVAQGLQKAELVFKNGTVVNVFTGELLKADVAVHHGVIAGVGRYDGETELDVTGKVICPGFIDAHLHLESTMVTPDELIAGAVKSGTTTFIVDPHEAANVVGCAGIDYILDRTEGLDANVYIMMPSCVPATDFEDNGCTLGAAQMKPYLSHPRVLGLGEVMDCGKVFAADEGMRRKLELFAGRVIDGHAGYLTDEQIAAYRMAGVMTDHECCSYERALQELRAGMQIHIRQGSGAKNLEKIVQGIVESGIVTDGFCFCTDDKHIEEIEREGHISTCVRMAIALGMDAVTAVRIATVNAARCYRLTRLGAVAPHYQADLLVLDDLATVKIDSVWHRGKRVSGPVKKPNLPENSPLLRTVHVAPAGQDALRLALTADLSPVIGVRDGQIVTDHFTEKLPCEDGCFVPRDGYNKLAIFERHKASGKIGLAAVRNFGIRGGAIASTVGHDSHNLLVIGDNDEDMLLAVEELKACGGGFALTAGGRTVGCLPLPVMGLISEAGHEAVGAKLAELIAAARRLGVNPNIDPFVTMSFLALPVIPHLRVTTRGLYDVDAGSFLRY